MGDGKKDTDETDSNALENPPKHKQNNLGGFLRILGAPHPKISSKAHVSSLGDATGERSSDGVGWNPVLQGKPFLPPAAGPGIAAARLQDHRAASVFLKMHLAPFNWGGGLQMAETGDVGEGEKKAEMVQ